MKTLASLVLAGGVALVALTGVAAAATSPTSDVSSALAEVDQFAALHPINSSQTAIEIDRTIDQATRANRDGDTEKAQALVNFARHELGMPGAS
jgi:hypothetical protein